MANSESNRKAVQKYKKSHRDEINSKTRKLSVDVYLPKEQKYLDFWQTIPNKKQFIIDALNRYREEKEQQYMTDWKSKLSEEALEKKRERDREYKKNVRDKRISRVGFDLEKGSKYEKIYKSIPNKAEWFRDCLEKYKEEHNNQQMFCALCAKLKKVA